MIALLPVAAVGSWTTDKALLVWGFGPDKLMQIQFSSQQACEKARSELSHQSDEMGGNVSMVRVEVCLGKN